MFVTHPVVLALHLFPVFSLTSFSFSDSLSLDDEEEDEWKPSWTQNDNVDDSKDDSNDESLPVVDHVDVENHDQIVAVEVVMEEPGDVEAVDVAGDMAVDVVLEDTEWNIDGHFGPELGTGPAVQNDFGFVDCDDEMALGVDAEQHALPQPESIANGNAKVFSTPVPSPSETAAVFSAPELSANGNSNVSPPAEKCSPFARRLHLSLEMSGALDIFEALDITPNEVFELWRIAAFKAEVFQPLLESLASLPIALSSMAKLMLFLNSESNSNIPVMYIYSLFPNDILVHSSTSTCKVTNDSMYIHCQPEINLVPQLSLNSLSSSTQTTSHSSVFSQLAQDSQPQMPVHRPGYLDRPLPPHLSFLPTSIQNKAGPHLALFQDMMTIAVWHLLWAPLDTAHYRMVQFCNNARNRSRFEPLLDGMSSFLRLCHLHIRHPLLFMSSFSLCLSLLVFKVLPDFKGKSMFLTLLAHVGNIANVGNVSGENIGFLTVRRVPGRRGPQNPLNMTRNGGRLKMSGGRQCPTYKVVARPGIVACMSREPEKTERFMRDMLVYPVAGYDWRIYTSRFDSIRDVLRLNLPFLRLREEH